MKSFICFVTFLCGIFAVLMFVFVCILFVPYDVAVAYSLSKYLVALLTLTMLAGFVGLVFALFEEESED